MSVPDDTPVSAIEGIGPAIEQLFQRVAVFTVFDLLRGPAETLHRAVSRAVSLDQTRRWRQAAALLEIRAVTPQFAEAMVRAKVYGPADVARLSLVEAAAIFDDARASGLIPDSPSATDIAEILKDGSVLAVTGALSLTLRDEDGSPIRGATVRSGPSTITTDVRGRCRLRRLPFCPVTVSIEAEGFAPLRGKLRPRPVHASFVKVLSLTHHEPASDDPLSPPAAWRRLSELDGDRLPTPTGNRVTSHEVPRDDLRDGDLLVVSFFYADGQHLKMVSKLLEFEDETFFVRWIRVPLDEFARSPGIGDAFRVTPAGLSPMRLSPVRLEAYKRSRRFRVGHLRSESIDDRIAVAEAWLTATIGERRA